MSNPESWIVVLEKLSALAFRYGPAFFALLFLLFLVRTFSEEFQKVVCRKDPPAAAAEITLYARLLTGSWVVGIILVAASVWFFFFTYQTKHTYEAIIVDLHPTALISVDDGYTKKVFRPVEGSMGTQDYYFAVLRDTPFKKGDKFRLHYWPRVEDAGVGRSPTYEVIEVEYVSSDGMPNFKITGDKGKFQLVKVN